MNDSKLPTCNCEHVKLAMWLCKDGVLRCQHCVQEHVYGRHYTPEQLRKISPELRRTIDEKWERYWHEESA